MFDIREMPCRWLLARYRLRWRCHTVVATESVIRATKISDSRNERSLMQHAYAHGHHASVVNSHADRTAANSAAHLVPLIQEGMSILDVGCGPGTITADLAQLTGSGRVVGVDYSEAVIVQARERAAARGLTNVSFETGDAYALAAADDSFDIVTAHQVLHHLQRPVDALREFRRVVRPGGIVALREVDYGAVFWYPLLPALDDWLRIMLATGDALGAQFSAGRRVGTWAREAGFSDVTVTGSQWTYANEERVRWWGEGWAERALASSFATQALELGLATQSDLMEISEAWLEWSRTPGAFMQLPHGEVIARG